MNCPVRFTRAEVRQMGMDDALLKRPGQNLNLLAQQCDEYDVDFPEPGRSVEHWCPRCTVRVIHYWRAFRAAEMRCREVGCGDGSDGKLKANVWYRVDERGEFVEVAS